MTFQAFLYHAYIPAMLIIFATFFFLLIGHAISKTRKGRR